MTNKAALDAKLKLCHGDVVSFREFIQSSLTEVSASVINNLENRTESILVAYMMMTICR